MSLNFDLPGSLAPGAGRAVINSTFEVTGQSEYFRAEPRGVKIMKRLAIAISLLLVAAVVSLKPGRAQESNGGEQQAGNKNQAAMDPLKVALLKWYPANTTTSFKVGEQPLGVVFDGANVWISSYAAGQDSLTKLRANDGTNLGTFKVGYGAMGLAFDGANIWVANSLDNTVSKLRASDGKTLGTFTVGQSPEFLAFDGEAMWVTNAQGASVMKLRISDGKVLGTFGDSLGPGGIAFDGTYIWVTNFKNTVTRFKPDGKEAGTFNVGLGPFGLAFDGTDIWVGNGGDGTVTKLRASDGAVLGTFGVHGGTPYGIAFDGENIWVTASPYIVELRRTDGELLNFFRTNPVPTGIAFDGANVWVANGKHGVSKM
jgi:DNA-binding beta-propeller fold protein YncE